jgi:hypothetical protein
LLHRDLAPDLQADEETKRKRDPTAFWCVRYQAIPMQVGCIFFFIEIFLPCKWTSRLTRLHLFSHRDFSALQVDE